MLVLELRARYLHLDSESRFASEAVQVCSKRSSAVVGLIAVEMKSPKRSTLQTLLLVA